MFMPQKSASPADVNSYTKWKISDLRCLNFFSNQNKMFLWTVCWDLASQAENLKTLTGSNNQKKRKKKKMNLQNCKSFDINKLKSSQ